MARTMWKVSRWIGIGGGVFGGGCGWGGGGGGQFWNEYAGNLMALLTQGFFAPFFAGLTT